MFSDVAAPKKCPAVCASRWRQPSLCGRGDLLVDVPQFLEATVEVVRLVPQERVQWIDEQIEEVPCQFHIRDHCIFLQEQSSDTRPSHLHDAEISDDTIGRALSAPLFTQEREEPAGRRQAYHSLEESSLPSQSVSVHVRTETRTRT